MSGSFAAVLRATVIDTDLVIHLGNIPQCHIISLPGFASILAIARGMIPEEDMVFDSEVPMKAIVQYTHYFPEEGQAKTM